MTSLPATFVHQLFAQAQVLGEQPALWTKRGEAWQATSWSQYAERVRAAGKALIALGLQRTEAVAILSASREEWCVSALGAMGAGAMAVGLYTTASPDQLTYILRHAEVKLLFVENELFAKKIAAIRNQLPHLRTVVCFDGSAEGCLSFAEFLAKAEPVADSALQARLDAATPDSLATLIYTSGTTGNPKGVMLSHENIVWTASQLSEVVGARQGDVMLSYLPLSHIAEQTCTLYGPLCNGMQVYFAQSFEKVSEHLKEVRPALFLGVPRVWEKFKARIESGLPSQPFIRRQIVAWARGVASRWHQHSLAGRTPSVLLEAQYRLAQRLVFSALRARVGFDRTRLFVSSAAPIARDVIDFMASFDIVLREVYGQSEVTGPTTVSTDSHTRFGTVGRPMTGVTVRLGEGGEVLVKSKGNCRGYYKEPEATAALLDSEGWLHSGDVGEVDADGYLRITGRVKDIIVTSGGKKTAPSGIEALLKAVAPVGHALVAGEAKNYLVALLTLDAERAPAFAKQHGWPTELAALARSPQLHQWLTTTIETDVNSRLSRFETIKKFAVVATDFSVDGGELTSTMKMRRAEVLKKYSAEIAALYA